MKWQRLAVAGGIFIAWPIASAAQTQPTVVVRSDAAATLGWFNAKETVTPTDTEWYSRSTLGGGVAGWYWTDNLKTEIEAGGTTRASLYGYWPEQPGNQPVIHYVRAEYSTKRVAASQHYQFFRNTWFHPFVGAGLDLTWKTREGEEYVSYPYNPTSGQPRRDVDEIETPETTDLDVSPFALIGYKAYISPRVFFRNDLRMTFGSGLRVDEVMVRFALGFDVTARRRQ